jgi:hypothetical protein
MSVEAIDQTAVGETVGQDDVAAITVIPSLPADRDHESVSCRSHRTTGTAIGEVGPLMSRAATIALTQTAHQAVRRLAVCRPGRQAVTIADRIDPAPAPSPAARYVRVEGKETRE